LLVRWLFTGAVLCWPLGAFGGWWRWLAEAAWLSAAMACWAASRWQSRELAAARVMSQSAARLRTVGFMNQWPDRPLVPDEWTDESGFHEQVVAAISEGYCPKHRIALRTADGYCPVCLACYELTSSAGTADASGVWAPWAVTDGRTVQVSRYI
jgi:hypothetical protein